MPDALDRIEGQPEAVALLRRARAAGRVAHAWAFVGPVGSGRTTTALAFAATLLCEHGGCGACRACRMVEARAHPDLHLVVPTPPASNPRGPRAIRIDAIRELERQAALRPVMARWKVFVVDDADQMTGEAPPAFLKTLEEPPARTVMILVLERARAVPPTVLSRCQTVRFGCRPRPVSAAVAEAAALLGAAREQGMAHVFQRLDRARPDRAEAAALVDAWWLWCRDLLVIRAGVEDERLLVDPSRAADLAREAAGWRLEDLVGALALCRDAAEALAVNVSPRLTLEVLLGRLALRAAG
jgi:DNA polymerase-3 subunit delta'